MDKKLIEDAVEHLQRFIDPGVNLGIPIDDEGYGKMANLLHSFELTHARKVTLLESYMLLCLAVRCHQGTMAKEGYRLTRSILDGDYWFGLYFRLLAQQNELRLLAYLFPVIKNMQIQLMDGTSVTRVLSDLFFHFERFLQEQEQKRGGNGDEAA